MVLSLVLFAAAAAAQDPASQAAPVRGAPAQEVLTDETVVSLVKAGLGPETIVAKIGASKGNFDTSTDALIRLKRAGVPDEVIAAMLDRSKSVVVTDAVADNSNPNPLVAHSPGITY